MPNEGDGRVGSTSGKAALEIAQPAPRGRRPPPSGRSRKRARSLRQLLGNTHHLLAPRQLGPDLGGRDAGSGPKDAEIVKEVRAFENNGRTISLDGIERDLRSLLGDFLGHLRHALAEELGRAGTSGWRAAQ